MEDPLKGLRSSLDQIAKLNRTYQNTISELATSVAATAAIRNPMQRFYDEQQRLYGSSAAILANAALAGQMTSVSKNLSLANIQLSRIFDSAGVEFSPLAKAFSDNYMPGHSLQKLADQLNANALFSHAEMARLHQVSLQSQLRLDKLQSATFGSCIGATAKLSNDLAGSLGVFTASYRDVIQHLPQITESQIPIVASYATVEYSEELTVLEQLSIEDAELAENEVVGVIDDEVRSANSDLIQLIDGARDSLNSRNPDKVRHVTTSVREMLTQILHRLAPDEDVKSWSKDPSHLSNGRPTRRARLMYICRHFSCDPLEKFIDLDHGAVIQLFDVMNAGTHGVASRLTDQQLKAIVCRAESFAFFMLRVSRG